LFTYGSLRDLHSFPTRRSSDLGVVPGRHPVLGVGVVALEPLLELAVVEQPGLTVEELFDVGLREFVYGSHDSGSSQSADGSAARSEEHTSELQSRENLVCRLLL